MDNKREKNGANDANSEEPWLDANVIIQENLKGLWV